MQACRHMQGHMQACRDTFRDTCKPTGQAYRLRGGHGSGVPWSAMEFPEIPEWRAIERSNMGNEGVMQSAA